MLCTFHSCPYMSMFGQRESPALCNHHPLLHTFCKSFFQCDLARSHVVSGICRRLRTSKVVNYKEAASPPKYSSRNMAPKELTLEEEWHAFALNAGLPSSMSFSSAVVQLSLRPRFLVEMPTKFDEAYLVSKGVNEVAAKIITGWYASSFLTYWHLSMQCI
jgi:hypothetical protein